MYIYIYIYVCMCEFWNSVTCDNWSFHTFKDLSQDGEIIAFKKIQLWIPQLKHTRNTEKYWNPLEKALKRHRKKEIKLERKKREEWKKDSVSWACVYEIISYLKWHLTECFSSQIELFCSTTHTWISNAIERMAFEAKNHLLPVPWNYSHNLAFWTHLICDATERNSFFLFFFFFVSGLFRIFN